ncbi:FAD-dependent monooxygenase [Hoyosella sp. G463]|uniref:FAD-dependent monooxygenase n=1 Tax=Lolliginicoccus lacisalsi TaxID=2742202 RepID=A0A927JEN1_9ACTN|nr:FAD-dependent monooxygenase [Lolliginicoccus lacisalsi]
MPETVDVVIVGARCAGTAMAVPLARAGRQVVVLDKAAFPADTLSTHVLFPMGVTEVARMGALERILALDPSRMTHLQLDIAGASRTERFQEIDGIDYGISVPRIAQDAALIDAAREAGADVREQSTVIRIMRDADGRAAGVEYLDPSGAAREIRASLIVGADGRDSLVASQVGEWEPYRRSRNGRGMVFRYMDAPAAATRWATTLWEGRTSDTIAFAFPGTPRGRLLILFMGPRAEVAEARSDGEAYWARKMSEFPSLAERAAGARNLSGIRATSRTHAYFRRSSGPGWALIGDAGHFKDPVLGQGMRDAMWMGRRLAEHVRDVLGQPRKLDRATRAWERARDQECLPTYHFGNLETRIPAVPPEVLAAVVRGVDGAELSDIHQRLIKPQGVYTFPRIIRAAASAVRETGPRPKLLRQLGVLAAMEGLIRAELLAAGSLPVRMPGLGMAVGENPDDGPWGRPPRAARQSGSGRAASATMRATVSRASSVTPEVRTLDLERVDGQPWPEWAAGAHIDVHLPSGRLRQYSLCGEPGNRRCLTIAVLREPEGRGGSIELHELAEGARVTVRGPRNNYALEDAPEYLFIAGGIGITPMLPMIAAADATTRKWRLLYRARSVDRMPFAAELSRRHGHKVVLSDAAHAGRPDIAAQIAALPTGAAVYCCGPSSLMDAVVAHAASRDDVAVHIERFAPTEKRSGEDQPFDVVMEASRATVQVPVGTTMLDAMRSITPDLPASCENGLCGSCEVAVLRGRPDHRDDIIQPSERARTDIMYPCVSRSLDSSLAIDA